MGTDEWIWLTSVLVSLVAACPTRSNSLSDLENIFDSINDLKLLILTFRFRSLFERRPMVPIAFSIRCTFGSEPSLHSEEDRQFRIQFTSNDEDWWWWTPLTIRCCWRHHLVGHFDEIFQCIAAGTVTAVTIRTLIHGDFDLGYWQWIRTSSRLQQWHRNIFADLA